MIRFACRCKNVLQAPDDQAGLTMQCGRCGLLLDIPLLSDMASLERDGTYKLSAREAAKTDLNELKRVYYPGTKLPDGTEIDLRGPVRAVPIPSAQDEEVPRERPKYDPETGELVQELGITADAAVPAARAEIPEARRVVDYNISPSMLEGSPQGLAVFAALFAPLNVVVMTIIFGFHVFLLVSVVVSVFLPILAFIPLAVMVIILSHYATVLEEMGLWDKDELPRPLRNVHPYDDLVAPFGRAVFSLALCYWPMLVVLYRNAVAAAYNAPLPFPDAGRWLLGLMLLGSIFLPVVFMTICTSGSLVNLRPDRLVRTMGAIGWRYVPIVALWLIAALAYLLGMVLTIVHGVATAGYGGVALPVMTRPYIAYPILLAGIYLTHAVCWYLSLAYRKRQLTFPWAAQRHEHRVETVRKPLHPKLSAAEDQARARANRRRGVR